MHTQIYIHRYVYIYNYYIYGYVSLIFINICYKHIDINLYINQLAASDPHSEQGRLCVIMAVGVYLSSQKTAHITSNLVLIV